MATALGSTQELRDVKGRLAEMEAALTEATGEHAAARARLESELHAATAALDRERREASDTGARLAHAEGALEEARKSAKQAAEEVREAQVRGMRGAGGRGWDTSDPSCLGLCGQGRC